MNPSRICATGLGCGMDVPLDDDAVGPDDQQPPQGALAHLGRGPEPLLAPVECCLGVRPSHAAKSRAFRNVSGGGARTAMAVAIRGPMPGTVISRRATSFSLARRAISASSLPISVSRWVRARPAPSVVAWHRRAGRCPGPRRWRSGARRWPPLRHDLAELAQMAAQSALIACVRCRGGPDLRRHRHRLRLCRRHSRRLVAPRRRLRDRPQPRRRHAVAALERAVALRRPLPGCVFHTDRGSQYASEKHRALLDRHGFVGSMSRRGNPYDNPQAESFMKTLKVEAVYLAEYDTYEDVAADLPRFIDEVYNERDYIPPWAISAPSSSRTATPAPLSKPPPDPVQRQGRTPRLCRLRRHLTEMIG
jgi:transposase InsO family protein